MVMVFAHSGINLRDSPPSWRAGRNDIAAAGLHEGSSALSPDSSSRFILLATLDSYSSHITIPLRFLMFGFPCLPTKWGVIWSRTS